MLCVIEVGEPAAVPAYIIVPDVLSRGLAIAFACVIPALVQPLAFLALASGLYGFAFLALVPVRHSNADIRKPPSHVPYKHATMLLCVWVGLCACH
jgi:hypothetical protein